MEVLKESLNEEIILKVIYPKLQRLVSHTKPKLDSQGNVINPMHTWILPWLPYLGSGLGAILDEVRRKLRSTISLIGKSKQDGLEYFNSCIRALQPWRKLFDSKTLFTITSDAVTPRFSRSLSRISIDFFGVEQDWTSISLLFEYFENGLMSTDDLISLIEGEVLPAWANTLYFELKKKTFHSMNDVKEFYTSWKLHLMASMDGRKISSASKVLRSESIICRYFFGGLEMIEAALDSNVDLLDRLHPPNPANCNYRITLMHRAKAAAAAACKETTVTAAVPVVHEGANKSASFQEVVAVSV
jgi:hypothetical protein